MDARHAFIAGTGLIGSSLGLALRANGWRVSGWDPDGDALRIAIEIGALDDSVASGRMSEADLIVQAGPIAATIENLPTLSSENLVTDVAAVKVPVVTAAGHLQRFVGGHPMAGRAGSGPRQATPNLFRGASWILTTDGAAEGDLAAMARIVDSVGARPIQMTAADHDRAVAAVSHLPHVLAASLVASAAADPSALELVAGSFRDLTRVAGSDPSAWAEILAANAPEVVGAIDTLQQHLNNWRTWLSEARWDEMGTAISESHGIRAAMAPDSASISIPLVDRPGELGRVGKALEASGADVRDIQLRHGEHGGGGLLTLSVHRRDAAILRLRLADEGFDPA